MKNTFLSICSILPLFLFANTNNIDNNIELNLNFGFHGKTVKKWGEIARFGKRYYRMINSIPPQTDKDLYLYQKILNFQFVNMTNQFFPIKVIIIKNGNISVLDH